MRARRRPSGSTRAPTDAAADCVVEARNLTETYGSGDDGVTGGDGVSHWAFSAADVAMLVGVGVGYLGAGYLPFRLWSAARVDSAWWATTDPSAGGLDAPIL